jgi:hypothetical protein
MTPPVAVSPNGEPKLPPEGAETAPIPNCFTSDAREVIRGAIDQYLLYPPLTFESSL